MFMPLLQKYCGISVYNYQLHGAVVPVQKPKFAAHNFFEGTFQEQTTDYLQDTVGYKGFLIALKNQVDFSVFGITHYGVECGKDNQLFSWNQIGTYCGTPTINDDSLQRKLQECILLRRYLDSLHIATIFVFAPGKPSFYRDKLPSKYLRGCHVESNEYHKTRRMLDSAGFDIVDLNAWFDAERNVSKYPLFPKLGTHWSHYAAGIAMDTLGHYLEQKFNCKLPHYSIKAMPLSDIPKYSDRDLVDLLNLLAPIHSDTLAYPEFTVSYDSTKQRKLKVMFIGDSFTWPLIDTKLPAQLFSASSRYWFYKHDIHDLTSKWIGEDADNVNIAELLKGMDAVIFLSTEAQNYRMDFDLYHAVINNKKGSQIY